MRWQDTDEATLEKQVTEIVVGVLVAGEMQYRAGIRRQHDWRIERKRELEEEARKAAREAAERERRRKLEIQRRRHEELVAQVRAWSRAAEIRRFVDAVRAATDLLPLDADARAERNAWLQWALSVAGRIDPLEGDDLPKLWAHRSSSRPPALPAE
jgi:signal transduction histidine kinase